MFNELVRLLIGMYNFFKFISLIYKRVNFVYQIDGSNIDLFSIVSSMNIPVEPFINPCTENMKILSLSQEY